MAQPPGTLPRRAALQMLDAVLRRGETLDQAAPRRHALPPQLPGQGHWPAQSRARPYAGLPISTR